MLKVKNEPIWEKKKKHIAMLLDALFSKFK